MKLLPLIFALPALVLPVRAAEITWNTAGPDNLWNLTSINWAGGATVFTAADNVTFSSATGETITVDAAGVAPTTMAVGANNGSWAFSGGAISGALTKTGSGTLTLSSANAFSSVSLGAGILSLGNAAALGSGTLNWSAASTLQTTSLTASSVIANAIALSGTGDRTLYMYATSGGGGTNTIELTGQITGSATRLYLNNSASGAYNPQFVFSNNANTFTANVWINRGGLQISSNEALGNLANSVTFDSNAGADLTFNNAMTYTRATLMNTGTDYQTKANDVTASGVISGAGYVNKIGTGTLTLTAANTYSGATTVTTGTLAVGGAGTLGSGSYGGAVSIASGASLSYASSTNQSMSGIISGAGNLAKSGTSTLTLGGANTYNGATTVTAGILKLTSSNASAITVSSGASLYGTSTGSTTGLLTLQSGSSLTVDAAGAFTAAGVSFIGGTSVVFAATPTGSGTLLDVLKYGATGVTGTASWTASNARGTFAQDTVNKKYTFTVGAATSLTWNTTTGTWDHYNTANFTGSDTKFLSGDTVVFTNPASAATVTLVGSLTPAAVSLNHTNGYTFSGAGSIAGSTAISKTGTGTLTLSTANSYSGGTALNGGNIIVTNTGGLGSGVLTVGAGAAGSVSAPASGSAGSFLFLSGLTGAQTISNQMVLPTDATAMIRKVAVQGSASSSYGANTYNFSGLISGGGAGTIFYFDSATAGDAYSVFRLSNSSNSFTGTVQFNRGSIQIDSDTVLGASSNKLVADGFSSSKVIFNYTGNFTHATDVRTNTNFDTGSNNVTATGVMSGGAAVTKVGSGTLTLAGTNSYTGLTTISAGTLAVSNGSAIANTGAVSIATGATFLLNQSETIGSLAGAGGLVNLQANALTAGDATNTEFAGVITGANGSLVKQGSGALTLSGTSNYTGSTTVSAGTLLVNGALGNTDVTVQSGATIGGSGLLAGALNFDVGAKLGVNLADPLAISGSVTFDGFGFSNLVGWDYVNAAEGTYTLLAGSNFNFANVSNYGATHALDFGNGKSGYFQSGSLQVVVIPETHVTLLGGLSLLSLLRRRRQP